MNVENEHDRQGEFFGRLVLKTVPHQVVLLPITFRLNFQELSIKQNSEGAVV